MKDEVEAGLVNLLADTEGNGHTESDESPASSRPIIGRNSNMNSFESSRSFQRVLSFSEWARSGRRETLIKAARPSKDSFALLLDVDAFVHLVAATLAQERQRLGWWQRMMQLDYALEGRAWVRGMFYSSYGRVENVIDNWKPPAPGMRLAVDDAADVIVDMLLLESSPLLQGGGPLHPHMDGQRAAMERGFDQMVRNMKALQERVDDACNAAEGIKGILRGR